jgi:PAS domain S-box-containing protein
MKALSRLGCLAFLPLLLCSLPLCPASGLELTPAEREYLREKGEIVFVSQTRYPPFEFKTSEGEPTGMAIELARWMAKRAGVAARFTDTSFQQAQAALLDGEADVLTSFFFSERRARKFNFTRPNFQVPASIFTRFENSDIQRLEDLEGKRVAMQKGDYAHEVLLSRGIAAEIVDTEDFGESADLVVKGLADAVIGDEQIVLYHLLVHGLIDRAKIVGPPLYTGLNCMATGKDNLVLAGILDRLAAEAEREGVIEEINRKWLGAWHDRGLPSWVRYLALAAGAALVSVFLVWFWNLRLRQLVGQRTAALEQHEKRLAYLSLAVESLGEMVVVTDLEHRITYANSAVERALGYRPGDLIGRPSAEFFEGVPGNPPDLREWIRSSSRSPVWRGELNNRRRDGSLIRVYLSLTPLLDPAGKIIGTVGVSMDITERRELEEQLRHSQKLEAIGQLAGGVAHDFNNILAGALGYLELIKASVGEENELFPQLDAVERLLWRGSELTGALLAFSRKGAWQREPLDLNRAVKEVAAIVERTAGKNHELVLRLAPGLRSAWGDRSQIHQVIMNLALNACEAMKRGGKLTISTRNVEAGDRIYRVQPDLKKSPAVAVSFADTGPGIPEEIRERIFEPFFSTKEDKTGVGLGLAVVKGIVDRHGGCIEVENGKGRGVVFTVYLPATDESELPPEEPPAPIPTGSEKILLVDDNPDFRAVAEDMLVQLGYTVLTAAGGREAREILEREGWEIELVILDMIMKGLSGPETFRSLRELRPGLPILICTGYAVDEIAGRLLDDQPCLLLKKPFPRREMAEKLRKLLDRPNPGEQTE